MEKAESQLESIDLADLNLKIIKLISDGCSFKKACQILDVEEVVAEKVIQPYLKSDKKFLTAIRLGLTEDQLEYNIAKEIVKNNLSVSECAQKLGITEVSASRYFLRYIRKTLVFSED